MPNGALRRALAAHLGSDAADEGLTALQTYRTATVTAHRVATPAWAWAARDTDRTVTAVIFATEGTAALDGTTRDTAGILLHSSHNATVRWSPDSQATVVWLHTESVVDETVPPALQPVALRSTPLANGLRAFASAVVQTSDVNTRVSGHVIERLLIEMVHGVLLEHLEADAAPYQAVRPMHRARMLMLLNRSDPTYGPQELANDLDISPRHLQRLFAKEGSSPAVELRKVRAELALSLLRDPQYEASTTAQIAMHSGFTNAAAMRRALHAVGAPPPHAARAR